MPIPAGCVAVLQQGNYGREDMSHAFPNTLHALDFTGLWEEVVAAADGTVLQVVASAGVGPLEGYGFGSVVKIQHQCGLHSLYAHLGRVTVTEGQVVEAGQIIGTLSNTGWAGNRHLHFSVHNELLFKEGSDLTAPIERLLVRDVRAGDEFQICAAQDLKDFRADPRGQGFRYASENTRGVGPLQGRPPEDLRDRIRDNADRLETLLSAQPKGVWLFEDTLTSNGF